jgi:PD-(D/E)XK endonuclease
MLMRHNRKVSIDTIEALAAAGKTAIEISKEAGISRQRVYQIARTNGIKLAVSGDRAGQGRCIYPKPLAPRINTGGVMLAKDSNAVGTVAELLVAADLVARGWYVYIPIVLHRGHDLIAYHGNRLITIEVRSGWRRPKGTLQYSSQKPTALSEYFAIVITGEPVIYEPALPDLGPLVGAGGRNMQSGYRKVERISRSNWLKRSGG